MYQFLEQKGELLARMVVGCNHYRCSHAGLEACTLLKISNPKPAIFLGWEIGELEPTLREQYQLVNVATAYSRQVQIPNFNGMLSGELTGAVLASANF